MIRKLKETDLNDVMQIWLNTNIKAHNFIDAKYWMDNYDMVKKMLPLAEIYVHEHDGSERIDGFIGLNGSYIEGIFVEEAAQSKGIGKRLLDFTKEIKPSLSLNVYQKNVRAVSFYQREHFLIQLEHTDENTGEKEFIMIWEKETGSLRG